ncbi:hypothetical protein [Paenibacillus sp. N3.4]|uniref:hypothetical protein n=1 Tax=Paenibacillus sp. N3.4 TaxID=2603222 RepID=UPI0011C9F698|nr:hypothetical protein [Paenibacillus sp. N3.4]TXK85143.1 hypothetical protein FU659_05205 [Paenibacillus sp. N3.4]
MILWTYLMLGIGIPVATFHHYMEESGGARAVDFFQLLGHRSFQMFQETTHPAASVILQRIIQLAQAHDTKNFEVECSVCRFLIHSVCC